MFRPFFRCTVYDAIPALGGVAILALMVVTLLYFDQMSWWLLASGFVAVSMSYLWNTQCISHNFIHNPYFVSKWINSTYSVLESLTLGVPHILYHHYHLNHHWGDNDAKGPDGTTKDWSSIYRYGKDSQPESFWRYCVISFFRVEAGPVVRVALRHRQAVQLVVESLALGAFWIAMALVNWRYFVFFYLPSYYLGWVFSYAEGYLEHYGCQPGNPYANSVSSYSRFYNFISFNNGYHQEHHWNPKTHWTRMRELHERIKDRLTTNHTRVLKGPHLTAFVEDWLLRSNRSKAANLSPTSTNTAMSTDPLEKRHAA